MLLVLGGDPPDHVVIDLGRGHRNTEAVVHVARPLRRAHAHHVGRRAFVPCSAAFVHQLLARSSHTCSDSISTPSRSKTTAAGSPTERPYRRACQHEPVATDDVEEIRALIHEYAERIDTGDLDGLAAMFADATWGSPGRGTPLRGTEQVRRGYEGVILYDGIPCTKHVISNVTIELTEREHGRGALLLHGAPGAAGLPAPADHRRPLPRPIRTRRRPVAVRGPSDHPRPHRRPEPAPARWRPVTGEWHPRTAEISRRLRSRADAILGAVWFMPQHDVPSLAARIACVGRVPGAVAAALFAPQHPVHVAAAVDDAWRDHEPARTARSPSRGRDRVPRRRPG